MTKTEQKRKIANFKRWLTRQKNRLEKKTELTCVGGPFDGHKLAVNNGHRFTAVFTASGQTGYYRAKFSSRLLWHAS